MKTVFSEEYQRLINALISARKDGGLLQADIAKKLSKPQSFVAKYEGCERRLDISGIDRDLPGHGRQSSVHLEASQACLEGGLPRRLSGKHVFKDRQRSALD